MKKLFTLLISACISIYATAQNAWVYDSVIMGTASANDVFYSMANGTVKTENNMNWHLAFSMNAGDSSSIWANHNVGNGYVRVFNIHKDISQWNTVALSDTASAAMCYNWDKGWYQGALNDIPSGNPFNFGWGTYNMATHSIYGDSIFLINVGGASGSFYKLFIDSLSSITMTYTFRVQDLTAPSATTYTIAKSPKYTANNFAYFNLVTGVDTMREPDKNTWDIVFNRYNTLASQGGPAIPYNVIGALGNRGIKFGHAAMVHVDTAHNNYTNYTTPWDSTISAIGYNWKMPPPPTWIVPDSNSYFVLDKSNNIYQLQFTGYSGSGTGNIQFRKRIITPVSVKNVNAILESYSFSPNPAQNELNITLQSKANTKTIVTIFDINGKKIQSYNIQVVQGINAYNVSIQDIHNGLYLIHLKGESVDVTEKLIIQK